MVGYGGWCGGEWGRGWLGVGRVIWDGPRTDGVEWGGTGMGGEGWGEMRGLGGDRMEEGGIEAVSRDRCRATE